jgi:hypothetical protein
VAGIATCVIFAPATSSKLLAGQDLVITWQDEPHDAMPRPTDPGADDAFDPADDARIELLEISMGRWEPDAPQTDLFAGAYAVQGKFLRLDVVLNRLVNPPGPTDPLDFSPFRHGTRPVYGFVEIDIDGDADTGGEVAAPQYRYLANVARFSGLPASDLLAERAALTGGDLDGDFLSPPFVERHGEDFHLALLGDLFEPDDIVEIAGNGDGIFGAGERWNIVAPLFHRAHGYEPFSLASGGAHAGEYSPGSVVQFRHDPVADQTRIILVFPFTNIGAGLMRGESPQPNNADPSDHASIFEALFDLNQSAIFLTNFPTGWPEETLIIRWKDKNPINFFDPAQWSVTALLGISYTQPDPNAQRFVWTDVYPNTLRGDVNGDGVADGVDRAAIEQFILQADAADGVVDGQVVIGAFADDFHLFDLNHDGVVDLLDVALVAAPADLDGDGDVDLHDFAIFQSCLGTIRGSAKWPACAAADLDIDGDVDIEDARRLAPRLDGPAAPGGE